MIEREREREGRGKVNLKAFFPSFALYTQKIVSIRHTYELYTHT
jgi:hypothetical protein